MGVHGQVIVSLGYMKCQMRGYVYIYISMYVCIFHIHSVRAMVMELDCNLEVLLDLWFQHSKLVAK